MANPTSCPSAEHWQKHLHGALSQEEQTDLLHHLDQCPSCQQTLEQLAAGSGSWPGPVGGDKVLDQEPALRQVLEQLKDKSNGAATVTADPAGGEIALDFLTPSEKPGSLGRLGDYEVLELVGRGGMGLVLKARDENLQRVVAVKVMAPALAAMATARRRFVREAHATAAVRNDHVINIHAVADKGVIPYLVMEFIAGQTLQDRLDQQGPLELREILRIGMQIAEGLAAAHKQGLVHRDIKPSNILLENGVQRVKITDFGLARAVDDASLTQSGVITGTPQYMAPEQARGEAVDHRADLFSLGSVLYALCTGRAPFQASGHMAVMKRVCEETPRPVRESNPDIPAWLEDIIAKLHAKKPDDRFRTAREVADLLGQHLAHLQQPGHVPLPAPIARPATAVRPRRRWQRVVLAVALVLVLSAAALVAWTSPWAFHYLRNYGTLTLDGYEPSLEKMIIRQGDKVVAVLTQPWADPVHLAPGQYELEFVCKPGYQVGNIFLDHTRYFSSPFDLVTRFQVNTGHSPGSIVAGPLPLAVERGEYIRIVPSVENLPSAAVQKGGWVPLFNGKDLTGWKVHPKSPGTWQVEDNMLVGQGKMACLFSARDDYENFHFRIEARINPGGEAAQAFGCTYALDFAGPGPLGYHVLMSGPDDPIRTGSLLSTSENTTTALVIERNLAIPSDTWFTQEVIANAGRVLVQVNGKTTADWDTHFHKGALAFFTSGFHHQTVLQLRKVEVKELPPRA